MSSELRLSDQLAPSEWLRLLARIGADRGYYEGLGRDHAALYAKGSAETLLVSFESMAHIRATAASGAPLGFEIADPKGWSHLSLIAKRETWFRARPVWDYFDRQIDAGFFEEFDRVIFYGAGMGGYAAAAFSVAAPGSTVILTAPQATLAPDRAAWDMRFLEERRRDFTSRYGFAPDMVEAAEAAFVIYDPSDTEDAMHASLFHGDHVHRIRYRRGGAGAIDADIRTMGVLAAAMEAAAAGELSPLAFHRALRARRQHTPWLRAAMGRVMATERPYLTGLFARAALREQDVPRFQKVLETAEASLALKGQALPLVRQGAERQAGQGT
ncbi:MAG: phosphoadenosine phosphosulfate reductase [Pseudomonadota bacterium]